MRNSQTSFFIIVSVCFLFVSFSTHSKAEISLGGYGSWGSLKDSKASIPSAKESSVGVYLLPSYELMPILKVGLYGEYGIVGQLTDPAKVSGYNKGFSGYLAGGALVFPLGPFRLTGAYSFLGKGTLKKKTSSGSETTLEKPKALHLILGISVLPSVTLDIGFTRVKYDVYVAGISSTQTRTMQDYRLGGSIHF